MAYFDGDSVVTMLNKLHASEVVAAMQYYRHANDVTGMNSQELQALFLEHAADELGHAEKLRDQIHILGGELKNGLADMLSMNFARVKDIQASMNVREMLKQDLGGELEAIEAYREAALKVQHSDPSTFNLLSELMADELEHANDFKNLLEIRGEVTF